MGSEVMDNDKTLWELIDTSVESGMLYDIAAVVHYILKDKYKVARLKSKQWYTFDGIKWKTVEAGPYFDLSQVVLKKYELYSQGKTKQRTKLLQQMVVPLFEDEETSNNNKSKQIEEECTKVQTIINKLKNVSFKESLCKECLYMFYDSQFLTNLDRIDNLVCFRNCTYDILKKEVVESKRSNMLSIYIDLDYEPSIFENDMDNLEDIINRFMVFRKSIVKRRRPNNVYSVKFYT
jgi:hypothetical protein